jgi:hypothetical protein
MKKAAFPSGFAARKDHRTSTDNSTAPVPIIHQLAAHQRFTTWRYTLSGKVGTLYMVSSEPITRDEALRGLALRYGCDRVLTLKPGGAV